MLFSQANTSSADSATTMRINEIPQLSSIPNDGRVVMLQPWFDTVEAKWHDYAQVESGDLIRFTIEGMLSGIYYARGPASQADLCVPLFTLVAQHLSFPEVAEPIYQLVSDLQLMSASIEKLTLLREVPVSSGARSFLVETELEYMFMLVRSTYDLLQSVVKHIAALMRASDGKAAVKKILPDSFADVALTSTSRPNEKVPRTLDELQTRYSLPAALASFYVRQSPLFNQLRMIRDGIGHRGKTLPLIFETERGFGISVDGSSTWSSLEVWKQHPHLPNQIGSVRALGAFLAKTVLDLLLNLEVALRKTISPALLPTAVSEGNLIFMTNPFIRNLSGVDDILASPWLETSEGSS
jgi:hypothetical protein